MHAGSDDDNNGHKGDASCKAKNSSTKSKATDVKEKGKARVSLSDGKHPPGCRI
jgi:hypothetical protein